MVLQSIGFVLVLKPRLFSPESYAGDAAAGRGSCLGICQLVPVVLSSEEMLVLGHLTQSGLVQLGMRACSHRPCRDSPQDSHATHTNMWMGSPVLHLHRSSQPVGHNPCGESRCPAIFTLQLKTVAKFQL